jgi:hypothetical protein
MTDWLTVSQSVSQSVCLGVGHPFGAYDQIFRFSFFCRKMSLLIVLGRPLWREDGFAIYSCNCFWPCQISQTRVQVQQNSRPYVTVPFDTPQPRGQVLGPKTEIWPSAFPSTSEEPTLTSWAVALSYHELSFPCTGRSGRMPPVHHHCYIMHLMPCTIYYSLPKKLVVAHLAKTKLQSIHNTHRSISLHNKNKNWAMLCSSAASFGVMCYLCCVLLQYYRHRIRIRRVLIRATLSYINIIF